MTEGISQSGPSSATAPRGGLADLVTTGYPGVRLADLALAPGTRAELERVLHEQRQRGLLAAHGLAPLRRLLFTGPPGTGKSTAASALASELSLPLVTIRIDALISRYTGKVAAKLRVLFDAVGAARAVCLFDDFDAIGARRILGYELDILEARRVLNTFLSFIGGTQPDSLIVVVTERAALLDDELLRRFEAVVGYALPDPAQALGVLRRRLAAMDTSEISWDEVGGYVKGLSQAQLVRAAESVAKQAILQEEDLVSTAALVTALGELRGVRRVTGFSRPQLPGPWFPESHPRAARVRVVE